MASRICTVTLALLACAVFASPSYAETNPQFNENYIAAKLMLGFGGSTSAQLESAFGTTERSSSLNVSFGAAGQYMVPLHDYFALGGLLGLTSWRSSLGGGSRNLTFDLALVPQGKFALTHELEIYLSVPIGLALDFLNELDRSDLYVDLFSGSAGATFNSSAAFGFMIAFFAGARYLLTETFGLFAEFGYTHRAFTHNVELTAYVGTTRTTLGSSDVSVSFGQFGLNIGAFF